MTPLQSLLAELDALEAKATPGPWHSARIECVASTGEHHHAYAPWISGHGPRPVTVGKATCIHADDMDFIAALRNAYPQLRQALAGGWVRTDNFPNSNCMAAPLGVVFYYFDGKRIWVHPALPPPPVDGEK